MERPSNLPERKDWRFLHDAEWEYLLKQKKKSKVCKDDRWKYAVTPELVVCVIGVMGVAYAYGNLTELLVNYWVYGDEKND